MNKRKLNLDELQVESFVTSFESDYDATVKGGAFNPSYVDGCRSAMIWCDPVPITKTIIKTLACPSIVDGCPSAPGDCTFDTGTVVKTVIDPVKGF